MISQTLSAFSQMLPLNLSHYLLLHRLHSKLVEYIANYL